MYMRVKKKLQRETSYYEPIGTDKEGNEIQLLDIMESAERPALDQIGLKDDTRKVYELLDQILSEREAGKASVCAAVSSRGPAHAGGYKDALEFHL